MEKMNKIMLVSSFFFFLINPLVVIIRDNITDLSMQPRDQFRQLQAAQVLVIVIVTALLSVKLFYLMRERKTLVSESLFIFFLMSAVGGVIQAIFLTWEFKVRELQVKITDGVFIFIFVAELALTEFVLEVFYKGIKVEKNKKILSIVLGIVIATWLVIELNMYNSSDIVSLLVLVMVLIFVAYSLFLYVVMTRNSLSLAKRVEEPVEKKAFNFMALSGLFLIIGYISYTGYEFSASMTLRFLNVTFFTLGYVFLYLGFYLPMRKKKQ